MYKGAVAHSLAGGCAAFRQSQHSDTWLFLLLGALVLVVVLLSEVGQANVKQRGAVVTQPGGRLAFNGELLQEDAVAHGKVGQESATSVTPQRQV